MTDNVAEVSPDRVVTALTGRKIPWARIALIFLAVLGLALVEAVYYEKTYNGLNDRAGMDQAQIAGNISRGNGFTTRFIRPFNVTLDPGDYAEYPELNSGPLYPYFLSMLFRLKTPCDQVASWSSLGFFTLTLAATFALGLVLFDRKAGLIAAGVLGLSASTLRIGASGTELPMVTFELTLLLIAVALHHGASSAKKRRATIGYAALAAALTAALYMTNYVFAFAVVPLAIYFGITGSFRRINLAVFLILAALLMAPCAYRNAVHTQFPVLGVRAWDIMIDTTKYSGQTLLRSTDPTNRSPLRPLLFPIEEFGSFAQKLVSRSADLASTLPSMVGMAALAFALVSLLYRFKKPTANAVRGLLYFMMPLMIVVFGLYSESRDSMIIFAPAIAVFASAYLMLLLEAKKLHTFFARVLIGGFLAVTAIGSIAPLVWGLDAGDIPTKEYTENRYYSQLGSRGVRTLIYTDVPWMAAWRTMGRAVWLPLKDQDVYAMEAKNLPMQVVILTPECETYSEDETWWIMHQVRLWRQYIQDPKQGLKDILSTAKLSPENLSRAAKYLQRLKRHYMISATISGFVLKPQDPLSPEDIQVLVHPDMAGE